MKAMKLALEALERCGSESYMIERQAIAALRQAIQEQALQNLTDFDVQSTHSADCYKWHHACAVARIERAEKQEPVAWMESPYGAIRANPLYKVSAPKSISWSIPLYTAAPPPRLPLTDEEIDRVTDAQWASNNHKPIYAAHRAYARAIEAAHGIKGEA